MKKSGRVTLTILGALTVVGCDQGSDSYNIYRSKPDCVADYSEAECREYSNVQGQGAGSGRWRGPMYSSNNSAARAGDPGPGRANRAMMSETIHRGGFGSIGHGFSLGG